MNGRVSLITLATREGRGCTGNCAGRCGILIPVDNNRRKRQLMFRRCRSPQTNRYRSSMTTFEPMTPIRRTTPGRAILALIAAITLSSCTEQPSPAAAPVARPTVNTEAAAAADPATDPRDTVKANASPGGVPTAYVAYFDAGQLQRITETRKPQGIKPQGADAAKGEYVFYGARLTQYRGAALNDGSSGGSGIELKFDMQGALTASNPGAGDPISDEEVGAIRNRAQLLRSVALARRATQSHMTH